MKFAPPLFLSSLKSNYQMKDQKIKGRNLSHNLFRLPPAWPQPQSKVFGKSEFSFSDFSIGKKSFSFQIQTTLLPDYMLQYRGNAFDLLNFQINVFSRSLMSKPNYSDGVSNGSGSPLSVPNGALAIPRARLTYSHSTCNTKHTILMVLQCIMHILVCW